MIFWTPETSAFVTKDILFATFCPHDYVNMKFIRAGTILLDRAWHQLFLYVVGMCKLRVALRTPPRLLLLPALPPLLCKERIHKSQFFLFLWLRVRSLQQSTLINRIFFILQMLSFHHRIKYYLIKIIPSTKTLRNQAKSSSCIGLQKLYRTLKVQESFCKKSMSV